MRIVPTTITCCLISCTFHWLLWLRSVLHQFPFNPSTMTSKKNTKSKPDTSPVPAPTVFGVDPTKWSPPLGISSTVLYPLVPYPTTTLYIPYGVPSNTPSPVTTNTSLEPTEEFKIVINNIIEAIPFLTYPMSYEL